jgi:3-oxoacyl-[acyl-carrier protein] reductase
VVPHVLDVRDPAAWSAAMAWLVEHWGGVDVVMNVAGYLRPAAIADSTDDDVDRHLDVNVKGVVHGTRAAAGCMAANPVRDGVRGHVINIASLASLAPIPGIGLYSASKYAVRGFSLVAAEELRSVGIAVTVVCPDAVRTPMLDLQLDYPEAALTFTAPHFLEPADISALILGRVLRSRPLLVSIPRHRAFLARLADLFPAVTRGLSVHLGRRGRDVQERMRADRSDGS